METEFEVKTEMPKPLLTFHNVQHEGEEIGKLDINSEGVLTFEGDMDKSAEMFIEHFLKPKWQEYIKGVNYANDIQKNRC